MFHLAAFVSFWQSGALQISSGGPDQFQTIAESYSNMPIPAIHEQPAEVQMRQFIAGMASVPAPNPHRADQSSLPDQEAVTECEPDFDRCPREFVRVGRDCIPGEDYLGPCSESLQLSNMSRSACVRWTELCGGPSAWHCVACSRDYRQECPNGWESSSDGCLPDVREYNGPCAGPLKTSWMNRAVLEQFQISCSMWWPCRSNGEEDVMAKALGGPARPR